MSAEPNTGAFVAGGLRCFRYNGSKRLKTGQAFALTLLFLLVSGRGAHAAAPRDLVKHVVLVIQENRSFDNLFNGFPGADTVRTGQRHNGSAVALHPVSLTVQVDVDHARQSFLNSYNGGLIATIASAHTIQRVPVFIRAYDSSRAIKTLAARPGAACDRPATTAQPGLVVVPVVPEPRPGAAGLLTNAIIIAFNPSKC